jgi:radical SAM superfamily enzyme YgiQ (UPF0313 family)
MKKKKKVLLIEPPFYRLYKPTYSLSRYPLGLGYLAAEITKMHGWSVSVYNADFVPGSEKIRISYLTGEGFENYRRNLDCLSAAVRQEIQFVISRCKPDVVGISVTSQNFASGCIVARLVKEYGKNIPVILGGPHATLAGEEALKNPFIDISVYGEGELTIVEILRAIESEQDISHIKGIIYKKEGRIIKTSPRPLTANPDLFGFPYDIVEDVLIDYSQYSKNAFRFIFTARGCPYNCFFCGSRNLWTRKVRFRTIENVIREIENLHKMGVTNLQFEDDTFGIDKKYTTKLCDTLEEKFPGLEWCCKIHADQVDRDILYRMKKAGCNLIKLGIESGSNEMLKMIRKGITIEQAFKASRMIKSLGIQLQTFFMVGFPFETEETLAATAEAMMSIDSDYVIYSIFTPYPGTEAYDYCKQHRLIGEDFDVSMYNHQSPANCFCRYIEPGRFRELVSKIEKNVDRKNTVRAIEWLESRQDKTDIMVYQIASLYKSLGEFKKSVQWFRKVLRESGEDEFRGGAYFHLGEILVKENKINKSLPYFEKCLELIPGHRKAREYSKRAQQ